MAVPLLPAPLRTILEDLERLPGIGPKSAQRIAFALLRQPSTVRAAFAAHLQRLQDVHHCQTCGMFADGDRCALCADPRRTAEFLCVVENALDVLAIERTGEYHGRYHVLGGVLSPLDHVGPDDLNIGTLVERIRTERPHEVILALNPSTEGDATLLYLKQLLADSGAALSRLAHGLPTGAALEFADDLTITRALSSRQRMKTA